MVSIALIYAVTTIVLGVIIINSYVKNRHFSWRYSGVAFKYSLALTLMSVVSSAWLMWITEDGPAFVSGLISALLQWPLLYIYMSVGVRFSRKLELPGALFWKRLSRYPLSIDEEDKHVHRVHDIQTKSGQMIYTSSIKPEYIEIQSMHSELTDSLNRKWWAKFDLIVILSIIAASVYTIVLFNLTQPKASEMIKLVQQSNPEPAAGEMSAMLLIIIFARLAIAEELFFRLAVQTFLEWNLRGNKHGAFIAILFSSVFWSLGHIGILTPEWVKLAQIFPFGIALGLIYRRYGIEAAILIHVVFNITMIFITPGFISL